MPRRRGAQPGNQNALKHGFYSASFEELENNLLASHENDDQASEANLIRVLIKRTMDTMANEQNLSLEEYLSALRTISFATAVLERLKRSRWFQPGMDSSLDDDNSG